MEYNLTLVLGAGSSIAMGYPIGGELRNSILGDTLTSYADLICDESQGIFEDQLQDFVDTFRRSQLFSIDSFLAKRKEYSEIGKRSIAAILLNREDNNLLSNCTHMDHWYQYFFNQITIAHDWHSLSLKKLAIVTFNYDRSLEHYLLFSLMNAYGKTATEAQAKIAEMKIVHVYGSLGPTNINEKNYFHYGESITSRHISIATSMLKVIPEGRDEDQTLQQARSILKESKNIGFLGFGFDEMNLKRLNSTETCLRQFKPENSHLTWREVVATCYGMTDKEKEKAANMTRDAHRTSMMVVDFKDSFLGKNCLEMLRETLILDKI